MFDIDMPTLVAASIFIVALLAVFFYYSQKNRKSRKEFYEKFNHFLNGLNLKPDMQEDWRNRYILALDQDKKMLIYCRFGENEQKVAVSLPEVGKVSVSETYQEPAQSPTSGKILDHVALKVQFKNPGKESLSLQIYSADDYSDLLGETVLAAKWSNTINQQLTK